MKSSVASVDSDARPFHTTSSACPKCVKKHPPQSEIFYNYEDTSHKNRTKRPLMTAMDKKVSLILLLILGFQECGMLNSSAARFEIGFDLYTQYSAPWGGQGLNMVSDAFPPGVVVELKASLTFKGDYVSGKPVTYVMRAPNGEIFSSAAITQADGTSTARYLLPNSKCYFGLWTVRASVDVTGTIVSDTLWFLMGWLIEVANVNVPKFVLKGTTMEINTTLTRICLQDPMDIMCILFRGSSGEPLTDSYLRMCISVTDALCQFVAASTSKTPITSGSGMYDPREFVRAMSSDWTNHLSVILEEFPTLSSVVENKATISAWSFTGMATVYANIITNRLMIVCCYECVGHVWITKNPVIGELPTTLASADMNQDGKVDICDLSIVAAAFGSHGPNIPKTADPRSDKWNALADLNYDGRVDAQDIARVAMNII